MIKNQAIQDFIIQMECMQAKQEMKFFVSLRDIFANSAMQANISNPQMWSDMCKDLPNFGKGLTMLQYVAKESYEMADAMLKQREKATE